MFIVEFKLPEMIDENLTEEVNSEINIFLEKLDMKPKNITDLTEGMLVEYLLEGTQENLAKRAQDFINEVEADKERLEKEKNIQEIYAKWEVGFVITFAILSASGLLIGTTLSPLVGTILALLGILSMLVALIVAILKLPHEKKYLKIFERLINALPKLKSLETKVKNEKIKNKLTELITYIEKEWESYNPIEDNEY